MRETKKQRKRALDEDEDHMSYRFYWTSLEPLDSHQQETIDVTDQLLLMLGSRTFLL